MTVKELLYLVNENSNIEIYDSSELTLLGRYDGKDDVTEKYLNYEVTGIFGGQNVCTICVEIDYV